MLKLRCVSVKRTTPEFFRRTCVCACCGVKHVDRVLETWLVGSLLARPLAPVRPGHVIFHADFAKQCASMKMLRRYLCAFHFIEPAYHSDDFFFCHILC
ncbi:Hypothetical protein, putative [Bodo saltans]|uniref:Uncharacterized protein n=1 Tax=Bodo saltans TaxID=75058 RepID=A0A0S4JRB4_BODSA|nr:Hypothetical protein, putative [Bodo saltans]|eukprot:CUG91051.1 Hypothetical protein, putative [Bodo saltans]